MKQRLEDTEQWKTLLHNLYLQPAANDPTLQGDIDKGIAWVRQGLICNAFAPSPLLDSINKQIANDILQAANDALTILVKGTPPEGKGE